MNKVLITVRNWRYWVLFTLAFIAAMGIFGFPEDGTENYWSCLMAGKFIGMVAGAAFASLLSMWIEDGSVPELARLAKEED